MAALLAGDAQAAAAGFRHRLAAAPADVGARYGLASALAAVGDPNAAAALEEARMLQALLLAAQHGADVGRLTSEPAYAASIANQLYAADHVAAASVLYGRAVAAGAAGRAELMAYGLALQHQGRAEEAIAVFRAALDLYPTDRVHQYLLYPHFMVEDGRARHAAEARAWARRWTPAFEAPAFDNPRAVADGCASATSPRRSARCRCASSSPRSSRRTIRTRWP